MKITYISHCGFLVETPEVSILFDYYNGELPPIRQDIPLYIFSSHRHEDHFNPEIFRLGGLPADTRYLLSYDICRGKMLSRKCPESAKAAEEGRLFSLRMEEEYEFPDITVWTMKSTDEGVAFLVRLNADRKLIYHCGDLNWWIWDGETKQEHNNMTARFKREVERLKNLTAEHSFAEEEPDAASAVEGKDAEFVVGGLDAAFLTLDARQEGYEFCGMDYYREQVSMKVIFPMHCWDQYEIIGRYRKAHPELAMLEPVNVSMMEKPEKDDCQSEADMTSAGDKNDADREKDDNEKNDAAVEQYNSMSSVAEKTINHRKIQYMADICARGEIYEV